MNVGPRPEPPVAPQRKSKPMAETARDRWLEGYQGAGKIPPACPATLGVHLADREGESQPWCVAAMRREPSPRAAVILRAKGNRRLVPGTAPRYGWAARQPTPALGPRTIDLARQPARPPRPGPLAVTAPPVTFQGARRLGGQRPPVTLSAVYAQEPSPPPGEAPVEGLLLPRLPVTDGPRACLVVPWDRGRGERERWCRVLTQGGQLEQVRMQTAKRLRNALAMSLIVAWRIHNITMAGRAYPEASCEVSFEPREWQTLSTMPQHCHPPPTPPPRREMVRRLAQRGGFFARRGDGEPGITAIWHGDPRLHDFVSAIETDRTVNAGERNV